MQRRKRGGEEQMEEGKVRPDKPDREEVRISVRNLVEFLLRQGDIDNRHQGSPENAMQEGSRIHRMIQRRMGAEYHAEVVLRYSMPMEHYVLVLEGRADGIIDHDGEITIDEIKGTYRDLAKMRGPVLVHEAQAKCYACMYGALQELQKVKVRMTYCNIETEDIRYFEKEYHFSRLWDWFMELLQAYRRWADYSWEWRRLRQQSIDALQFPFPYRDGQKELASYVYQTIYHQKKLFLEAPTGVGKTISVIFPALKAMGRGMGEKLFYLTAKTITRTVAEDTFALLRDGGLSFKSVILTAKEKICFLAQGKVPDPQAGVSAAGGFVKPDCNPDSCPFAKGHYDRVNDAMYALLTTQQSFTREKIEEYAIKFQVCPFELCLDMSLFADGIICDYNYLFDPHVYLKRFFAEGNSGSYLFLIDEAHNLLERGREMYSAFLIKEDLQKLRREIKTTVVTELEEANAKPTIKGQMTLEMTKIVTETSTADDGQESLYLADTAGIRQGEKEEGFALAGEPKRSSARSKKHTGKSIFVRQGYGEKLMQQLEKCNKELLSMKRECERYMLVEDIEDFVKGLTRLYGTLNDYLEEQEEVQLPVREGLLEFYFAVAHFLAIYERMDENYVKYTQSMEDGNFMLKLFCVNPSLNLRECMARGRSSILFSATLLPIQYYKGLLGGGPEDYEVYAKSVFHPKKRALLIAGDVTSKYTRRSEEEYRNIARYIYEIVKNRHGNYMVFCPSYAFLKAIYGIYQEQFATQGQECILQQDSMTEEEREEFLLRFLGNSDCDLQGEINMGIEWEDRTLIGFCVLGGIFSEGIDLKKDSLIGAIIVGTGLPQVCVEREILKAYFDGAGEDGFAYSYRYPGMNKVLQAAGRVIRTAEDIGIVALLDERFLQYSYRRLFPREWEEFERVSVDTVAKRVERFWDEWL